MPPPTLTPSGGLATALPDIPSALVFLVLVILAGDAPRHRLVQAIRIAAGALVAAADVLDGHR